MSLTIHYRRFFTHHVSGIRNLATDAQPRLGRNAPNGLKLSATQLLNDKIWGIGNALATAIEEPDGKDATSMGHIALAQQRQMLHYMRLIENEMPQLVAYRKPFIPPPPSHPLIVRSISYGGEEHPATVKRTIVTPVALLPLRNDAARHRFKVLAGVRWSIEPPKDAGIGRDEDVGKHGYIKISCEDFPKASMNLKWASDAIDRLIAAANNPKNKVADVPLDTRHLDAKARKAKKGEHVRGRGGIRPSIRDFPQEWLPTLPVETESLTSTQ